MPERVRRIKKKSSSSWPKRIFLFVVFVVLITGLSLAFKNNPPNKKAQELAEPVVNNQETVAAFCASEDCFLINKEGVAFKQSSRPSGNLVFVIDNKVREKILGVGDELIDPNALVELLFLRKKIKEEHSLHLANASTQDLNEADYDFTTSQGWVLRLSIANNANATLEVLDRVLGELGSTSANLEYIDLRLPTKVFYRMIQ